LKFVPNLPPGGFFFACSNQPPFGAVFLFEEMQLNTIENLDAFPDCGFISARSLAAMLSVSQVTVWRWTKAGKLPAPRKLGEGTTRWNVGEVRAALASLAA
jgi:predicted DNA-binding transcriptional regulator AlpA